MPVVKKFKCQESISELELHICYFEEWDTNKLLNSKRFGKASRTRSVDAGAATAGCGLDATGGAVLLMCALSAEQLLSAEGVLPAQVSKHLRLYEQTHHKNNNINSKLGTNKY